MAVKNDRAAHARALPLRVRGDVRVDLQQQVRGRADVEAHLVPRQPPSRATVSSSSIARTPVVEPPARDHEPPFMVRCCTFYQAPRHNHGVHRNLYPG